MATLERAIEIAVKVHAGQMDKGGAPYILHPLRVMLAVRSQEARMAAVLHDVVEDSHGNVTIEQLRAEGFPEAVVEAVERLRGGIPGKCQLLGRGIRKDGSAWSERVEPVSPGPG
jgi:(p)ppGpp synthase/HD superfamily hydrolase